MPARSKAQQHMMGMALAAKRGHMPKVPAGVAKKVRETMKSMTTKEVEDYAGTKTKHLPRHKRKG